MTHETNVKLTSPSGDKIEAVWTGERLLVFMTSADGSRLVAYDSHVAALSEQGLLEESGTQQPH